MNVKKRVHGVDAKCRIGNAMFAFFAIFWLGLLVGVSFLATPVKFQAASLNLPVALEVGRVTFALFSKVEWGLFLLLAAAALMVTRRAAWWFAVAGVAAILLIQSLWLLPALDFRVAQIIAGKSVPAANDHFLYVAGESIKALLLLALSVAALRGVRRKGCGFVPHNLPESKE